MPFYSCFLCLIYLHFISLHTGVCVYAVLLSLLHLKMHSLGPVFFGHNTSLSLAFISPDLKNSVSVTYFSGNCICWLYADPFLTQHFLSPETGAYN